MRESYKITRSNNYQLTEQLDERVEPERLRPELVPVDPLVGHLHLLQGDAGRLGGGGGLGLLGVVHLGGRRHVLLKKSENWKLEIGAQSFATDSKVLFGKPSVARLWDKH